MTVQSGRPQEDRIGVQILTDVDMGMVTKMEILGHFFGRCVVQRRRCAVQMTGSCVASCRVKKTRGVVCISTLYRSHPTSMSARGFWCRSDRLSRFISLCILAEGPCMKETKEIINCVIFTMIQDSDIVGVTSKASRKSKIGPCCLSNGVVSCNSLHDKIGDHWWFMIEWN